MKKAILYLIAITILLLIPALVFANRVKTSVTVAENPCNVCMEVCKQK